MSLTQTNSVRAILADAGQRLAAMPLAGVPPQATTAISRARDHITKAIAAVARAEQFMAKDLADQSGDTPE